MKALEKISQWSLTLMLGKANLFGWYNSAFVFTYRSFFYTDSKFRHVYLTGKFFRMIMIEDTVSKQYTQWRIQDVGNGGGAIHPSQHVVGG